MAKLSESYKNKIRNEYKSLPDDQKWQYLDELIRQNKYTYSNFSSIFKCSMDETIQIYKYLDIKICSKQDCENSKVQSRSNFYPNKITRDGLSNYCKVCCYHLKMQTYKKRVSKNKNNELNITQKKCGSPYCVYGNIMQDVGNFYKKPSNSDGYDEYCKSCRKNLSKNRRIINKQKNAEQLNIIQYKVCSNPDCSYNGCEQPISNFYKNICTRDGYNTYCKDCCREIEKEQIEQHKRRNDVSGPIDIKYKKCTNSNCVHGDRLQSVNNFYRCRTTYDGYSHICKNCSKERGSDRRMSVAYFETYRTQLESYHEIRRDPDNNSLLQVKCVFCDNWLNPTNQQVNNRLISINQLGHGENHFYCSDECKKQCPVYGQELHRKDDPDHYKNKLDREVQPELRQMKIEQVGYICQRCGKTNFEDMNLECHHIEGVQYEPIESADLDMVMMTCEKCHKEIHQIPGCTYQDMKCKF